MSAKKPSLTGAERRALLDRYIEQSEEELVTADGLDAAIIGVAQRCGQRPIVLYSIRLAIEALAEQGMSYEEASEYLEFNSIGAWIGDQTPGWVTTIEDLKEAS